MVSANRGRGSAFGWIFVGVGVFVFLGLAVAATILAVVQHQQESWPRTEAVVVDHEARTSTSRDRDGRTSTSTTYAAVYEYSVAGRQYRSSTSFSSSDPPAVGTTTTIGYDPTNPAAIAVPGEAAWVPWMLGGMAVLFLGVFGGVGLMALRDGPRQQGPVRRIQPIAASSGTGFPAYRPEVGDSGVSDGNPFTPDDRR